uniref:Uncharacterized protein n=1 Tax=Anopheles coluzzii TaxID=1518534 RepID=A0A8W7P0P6_ANOCL
MPGLRWGCIGSIGKGNGRHEYYACCTIMYMAATPAAAVGLCKRLAETVSKPPPYSCVGSCPLTTNTAAIGEEDVGEVGFDPPCSASSPARSRSGGVTEAKELLLILLILLLLLLLLLLQRLVLVVLRLMRRLVLMAMVVLMVVL